MKKRLNILHLESSFGWGGQEMRILKESEGMREIGHNIIIAVEKNGGLIPQAKAKGFTTYSVRFKKIFWFFSFFKLLFIMKKHRIDVVNTHSSCDAWLGGLAAKLLNIYVIRTRHLSTKIKGGLNARLLYGFLADCVVTTCFEMVQKIIGLTKKNSGFCKSVPTGVDFKKFAVETTLPNKFRKDWKIKRSDFLVGSVCFMRSWKGIDDFLEAAKILENEKDIKFIIIGGGHIGTYLKKAKDLNLKNVIFTHHLSNPKDAIASLDVFVLLSTAHEGVSQASLQAAYLKKPLITTSTGGLKEVCIDEETGIQVPVFSSSEVAKAILRLKSDERLRNRFAKRANEVALKFSHENMLSQMLEIYEKI